MHTRDQRPEDGCPIYTRLVIGEPTPELVEAGYVVELIDEMPYVVPPIPHHIPAAIACEQFELCEQGCRTASHGQTVAGIRIGLRGWL